MNSYEIKDGVIYVRDFRRPPDYFRENGFAGIRKVVFADDISVIPRCSMQLLKELREIVWPKCLKVIGEGCFSDCSSLTELKLPDGLETIGESAFQNAENVKYVKIVNLIPDTGASAAGSLWSWRSDISRRENPRSPSARESKRPLPAAIWIGKK